MGIFGGNRKKKIKQNEGEIGMMDGDMDLE